MLIGKRHLAWITALIIMLLAAVGAYWLTAEPTQARSYSGYGQVGLNGELLLDFSLSPTVAQPGDTVNLAVRLTNRSLTSATPEVSFQLPPTLRSSVTTVPAGATINVQSNQLDWLPLTPANGGTAQLNIPLRVETADINNPEQVITAVLTNGEQSQQGHTTIWVGISPQIDTALNVTHVAAGQTVRLLPTVHGPGPFTQTWHLGDGRQVVVNNPEVVFPKPGVYDVTLEVANPLARVSRTERLTIVPHPAAQFVIDDDTPGVGQTVQFTNQSGGDGEMGYLWHFGDGTTSEERNPSHQYNTPGLFQAQLTVSNEYGSSQAFWAVAVGTPPFVEMFMADSTVTGELIIGQSAADEGTESVVWDMGDGRSYTIAKVNHLYRQPGDYYVTVTATNQYGSTQTGQWVRVDAGRRHMYLPLMLRPVAEDEVVGEETAVSPTDELALEPVELEETFVMEPLTFEPGTTTVEALFLYINEARRQFDLPPLTYNYELTIAAQLHAEDMAAYNYTGHTGADGSRPQERFVWANYPNAYAGEATAWGFEDPRYAVEFWVNSPPHRPIILNQYANEVGVGQGINYKSNSVWYWTAEFGNSYGGRGGPALRLNSPAAELAALNTEAVAYRWNWSAQLGANQRFTVYLFVDGEPIEIGTTNQPWHNLLYRIDANVLATTLEAGTYEWQVVLLEGNREVVASERRTITISADPTLPTPTPDAIVPTAVAPLSTPTAIPTVTPTPAPEDAPPAATRVIIPTATAVPQP
ncbi:MAG: PKD domain-containing protein [Chloroflexota bacterium]